MSPACRGTASATEQPTRESADRQSAKIEEEQLAKHHWRAARRERKCAKPENLVGEGDEPCECDDAQEGGVVHSSALCLRCCTRITEPTATFVSAATNTEPCSPRRGNSSTTAQ